jgi:hypothetical protein
MRDGVEVKVKACSGVIQCRGLGLGSKPRGSDRGGKGAASQLWRAII